MNISYLLIGGNEGDRMAALAAARANIEAAAGSIRTCSSLYETEPWGKTDQADFLNQALCLETVADAPSLMNILLGIEEKMGRKRMEKYGSRIIDIDILFFNDAIIHQPGLIIPHAEVQNRRFALAPLEEIAPDYIHPVLGVSVRELLLTCTDPLAVKKINA
ncbi:2-amino-4-hydroxy-6-hydroxymethyldihydropteridine diphosphokinase [Puia dinghuensis]|uniref:2-amino-4-hydroxy-6-hydroxymethyldihydropteridine pyrophosphokinase n=1 Tax=Puia dinghuensis TaxID=1792502 RepID=A0A8J2XR27_9BACT|nr:2-amino-4-hydroxy-6-hydroxymethyldihydropteridine diphosphokinase [Puia dinghuensis]GGA87370.1 2-amino-4-hydroxy-6-hydroxymethyldihydropteridine diphosphokinase [Puia dinghuensis]